MIKFLGMYFIFIGLVKLLYVFYLKYKGKLT